MKSATLDRPHYSELEDLLEIESGAICKSPLVCRMGLWSAVGLAVLNVVYMVMVLAAQTTDTSEMQLLSSLPIVLALPVFLALLTSLHYYVPESKKLLTTLALSLGGIYVAFWGFTHLIQLTLIRENITKPQYESFVLFDLQNRDSIVMVTDVGGYFFLGLALLSAAFALGKKAGKPERWVRRLFITAGGLGFIVLFGFLTTLATIRYLAEAAFCPVLLVAAVWLALMFRRAGQSHRN